ncbi:MAG: hypothetical protein K2Q22_06535, partial [Cytophagales bacterium]|nr:hypothetical protein [Cytophagales bacterium]
IGLFAVMGLVAKVFEKWLTNGKNSSQFFQKKRLYGFRTTFNEMMSVELSSQRIDKKSQF